MAARTRLVVPEISREAARRWAGRLARRAHGRCQVPVGKGRIVTTNPDGRTLFLDASDTSLTPSILTRGSYEPGTTRLLSRLVRSGQRVLDVGSNIGWHTLLAADRVGPSGQVVAFEPNPAAFDLLHLNLFVNGFWGRCRLARIALSDAPGVRNLQVAGSFLGSGRLLPFEDYDLVWQNQQVHALDVEVSTLDQVVHDNPRFDVLKIDVEGAEMEVFRGAKELFAESPHLAMVMEFTPRLHGQAMLDWLHEAGFVLSSISRAGVATQVSDESLLTNRPVDILAAR